MRVGGRVSESQVKVGGRVQVRVGGRVSESSSESGREGEWEWEGECVGVGGKVRVK